MNLGMYLARSARFWPHRPAVLFRDGQLSYRDLELRSNRLGIVEFECALYKLGLVKVALNSRLAPQELADALANAEPVAVAAGPEHRGMVDAATQQLGSLQHRIAFEPAGGDSTWRPYEP